MGNGKGAIKGTATGKGKEKGKGHAKGGGKVQGKGKSIAKDSMGLIKDVKQGNYKCSLRHRQHSKAYNQKFNELKMLVTRMTRPKWEPRLLPRPM
jgi:hypothetical protein